MCSEARSHAHLLSSIVLLAMNLAKLKRSVCIVGNDIHVKKCSLHFCRVFQSAEGVVDTLGWTQRNSLPHPQKVTQIIFGLQVISTVTMQLYFQMYFEGFFFFFAHLPHMNLELSCGNTELCPTETWTSNLLCFVLEYCFLVLQQLSRK